MPKRTTNSPGARAVTTIMVLAALGVGVFAAYVRFGPNVQRVPDEIRRPSVASETSSHRSRPHGPSVEIETSPALDLKIPVVEGDTVHLGKSAGPVPSGTKPMVFLATATLKQLKIEGARALGVDVKGRNALIDFNEALDKGYGSTEEGYLISSLQWALGQFPEIDTFQIVIDGQVKDTLGQLDLSEPISVTRPDGKPAVPDSSTTPSEDPASPSPN